MQNKFPDNFLWGVATAAAQIEGAPYEDGRSASIWDVFSKFPGSITNGDLPDVACDSYHRLDRDIALLKELGVNSYRFSFSWSRILPDGTGKVNQAGIEYYKKLLTALRENDIVPNASVYHWDLPYVLQARGGFGNREIINWYSEYINVLFDNFGDDVGLWATFNEPIATYVGYAKGFFAPGLTDEKYARQALHNLLLCHGEGVRQFRRRNFENSKIGIVVDVWHHFPARADNPDDADIAEFSNEIEGCGMFLNPLFLGRYTDKLTDYLNDQGWMPEVRDGDMELIAEPIDFYGLNFYNGLFDNADEIREQELKKSEGGNYQNRPEYHPEVVDEVIKMLVDKYHIDIPIYITENGIPQVGITDKSDILDDQERIDYVTEVLKGLHRAINDGIDIRGYFLWSLMDNFEWSAGFSHKFGLYYTDFDTLDIIPKKSASWYRDVVASNEI